MSGRRNFIKQTSMLGAGLLFIDPLLKKAPATPIIDPGAETTTGLRFRQVHLDFHTSGLIEEVAKSFDPEEFASTLKKANVNSVTSFARCHHGYLYYNSKKHPERIHPHLANRNLLKEQIDACHRQDIRVPVYTTVQWDYYTAQKHPEWLVRDENGTPIAMGDSNVFHAGFYNHLDIATPYIDFLKDHIRDLFEAVPVDGLFLDIHHIMANANEGAIEGMLKKGMDPTKEAARLHYNKEVLKEYKQDLTAFIRKLDKDCTIFYNSGHVGPHIKDTVSSNTHLELESLPSGGWGYLHLPLTARYARNLGEDIMGMTGKFHTSWGDFHSLKNSAALEFETSMMLALNAKCSIGDQLHPRGILDKATYDLIGEAYSKVARKEAWCEGATAITEIGVMSTEEYGPLGMGGRTPEAMMGIIRILQEGAKQFDILDSNSDLKKYKVIILPDNIPVSDPLSKRLQTYMSDGGSLIASFQSGLSAGGKNFNLDPLGISLVGEAPYSPDFIVPKEVIGKGLPGTELVMYLKGMQVKALPGSEVLADANVPYFNREWNHFSSHKHTPSAGKVGYPAVIKNGRSIYFMHPIFTQYQRNAPRWCKQLVLNAIDLLHPQTLVKHSGPSSVIALLNEQVAKKRSVLHLLHYIPERRGTEFDIIEDVIPIYNLKVSVKLENKVSKVMLVPQNTAVPFKTNNQRIEFEIKEVIGHQMIAFS
jgi:hypothetical protein